jgi:hypothetical protein
MRPELWRSLASLMDALEPPAASTLRLSSVMLDMPLEIAIGQRDGEMVILGSPPRWRWTTAFDERLARMRVELAPEAASPPGSAPSLPLVPGESP